MDKDPGMTNLIRTLSLFLDVTDFGVIAIILVLSICDKLYDMYQVIKTDPNWWGKFKTEILKSLKYFSYFVVYLGGTTIARSQHFCPEIDLNDVDDKIFECLGYVQLMYELDKFEEPVQIDKLKKIGEVKAFNLKGHTTYYFLVKAPERYILCYRGSTITTDWLANAVAVPEFDVKRKLYFHKGWLDKAREVFKEIKKDLLEETETKELLICGHSLGAALSTITNVIAKRKLPSWKIKSIGYATPSCIDRNYNEKDYNMISIAFRYDIVPVVTLDLLNHFVDILFGTKQYYEPFSPLLIPTKKIYYITDNKDAKVYLRNSYDFSFPFFPNLLKDSLKQLITDHFFIEEYHDVIGKMIRLKKKEE